MFFPLCISQAFHEVDVGLGIITLGPWFGEPSATKTEQLKR